jgi:hypothetical protein
MTVREYLNREYLFHSGKITKKMVNEKIKTFSECINIKKISYNLDTTYTSYISGFYIEERNDYTKKIFSMYKTDIERIYKIKKLKEE